MGDFHRQQAVPVDAARQHRVSHGDRHRGGLSRQRREVKIASALANNAVGRHLVSRPDDNQIPRPQPVGIDIPLFPVFQQARPLGPQLQQRVNRAHGAVHRTVLQILAQPIQQHNGAGLGILPDDNRAKRDVYKRQLQGEVRRQHHRLALRPGVKRAALGEVEQLLDGADGKGVFIGRFGGCRRQKPAREQQRLSLIHISSLLRQAPPLGRRQAL